MHHSITTEPAASSSSPSNRQWKYDVFLSFRGEDTRFGFVDHLYSILARQGISTFRDEDQLLGGDLPREIFEAIEESRISVVIFSKNYASSTWCLAELAKILECVKSQKQIVVPIYYDVEPSDVGKQTGPFDEAFDEHQSRFKDDVEKVSRWRSALTEAANFPGMDLSDYRSESKFIDAIIEFISQKLNRAYLTYETNYLVGIDSRIREMNDLLGVGVADVRMVGIWGTGGMGKTTLAQAVYNSVAHKFEGSCFLGNVRENSETAGGLVQLQKTLLYNILGLKISSHTNVNSGVNIIKSSLRHKRVLLIIDDVDHLDQLKYLAGSSVWFGLGSRIIITTRAKHLLIAHRVDFIYQVKELESDEALELFSSYAFPTSILPDDYQELVNSFVGYAQGNPLALTAMGSLLYGKSIDEWQSVLVSYKRAPASNIHEILKITKKEHALQSTKLNEADSPEKLLEDEDQNVDEWHSKLESVKTASPSDTPEIVKISNKRLNEAESPEKLLEDEEDQRGRNERDESEADDVDGVNATETIKDSPGGDEPSPDTQEKDQLGHVTNPEEPKEPADPGEPDPADNDTTVESDAKGFSDWIFLIISLILEIISAIFDQLSSPKKPKFAKIGTVLAIVALVVCLSELIYKGRKRKIKFGRCRMCLWWFFCPRTDRLFATLPDLFGLICGISQCASSIVQYVHVLGPKDNPFKVNLLPILFLICVGGSKLFEDCRRSTEYSSPRSLGGQIRPETPDPGERTMSSDRTPVSGSVEGGTVSVPLSLSTPLSLIRQSVVTSNDISGQEAWRSTGDETRIRVYN